jgi:uncharacterized protein (TIGR02594 family)
VSLASPPWLTVALQEARRGVFEVPGDGHHPRILDYHATTTLAASADEIPWCAAFVGWCMVEVGIHPTRSAAARSWLPWGRSLGDIPALGAVAVLSRGAPPSGHVGFYVGHSNPREILLLGGNQSNSVCIRPFPTSRVLSYRWPVVS